MAARECGQDAFDETVAEINNSMMASYGMAVYLARRYAPETIEGLNRELERYRELMARLVKLHRQGPG
jgi:hypothetical protein